MAGTREQRRARAEGDRAGDSLVAHGKPWAVFTKHSSKFWPRLHKGPCVLFGARLEGVTGAGGWLALRAGAEARKVGGFGVPAERVPTCVGEGPTHLGLAPPLPPVL